MDCVTTQEMNIFLKAYNNKQVLSVHALIVFTIFCFFVDEKIKLKVLLASLKLLTNFENPSSNPRFSKLKCLQEAACDSENPLKDLENHQRIHRKYGLKYFNLQKNILKMLTGSRL